MSCHLVDLAFADLFYITHLRDVLSFINHVLQNYVILKDREEMRCYSAGGLEFKLEKVDWPATGEPIGPAEGVQAGDIAGPAVPDIACL